MVDKSAIAGFVNNADLDKKKVATLATKAELNAWGLDDILLTWEKNNQLISLSIIKSSV